MPPVFNKDYKDMIGAKLTRTLGFALKNGQIKYDEVALVASHILGNIHEIPDYPGLITFLTRLTEKWSFFSVVLLEEVSIKPN